MLAVFVGLFAERLAVQRSMEVLERLEVQGFPVVLGSCGQKPLLLCRTGLGEARSERAASAVLDTYLPSAVVSARVASGVPDEVRIGDIVFCQKMFLCRKEGPAGMAPAQADRRLLALAEQAAQAAQLRYTVSDALTAAQVAPEPLDRERIRKLYDVAVVDTEGYWLNEAANRRGIPFLAVRSSLGRSFDRAAESADLASRGTLSPGRLAVHLLRRPGKAPGLLSLALSMRTAVGRLSAFMRQFLQEWSQEP